MKVDKFVSSVILALVLSILITVGACSYPAFASPPLTPAITAVESNTTPEQTSEVKVAADKFLKSIPRGYYALTKVRQLKNLNKKNKILLVDVRSPREYSSGHIPNAINIPLRSLTKNLDKIPTDKQVVFYCSTGHRSAMAMTVLQMLGYSNVRSFPPSFQGWKAADELIEK